MRLLTIRGCILGIKKEAPRKAWRFLNSTGVGAGFLLSRAAIFFTAEDGSIYPAPVQIRATPPPGKITTRNKISFKNYLVAFKMLDLLMRLVNTFRYRHLDIYCQFVGDGGGEIRGWENRDLSGVMNLLVNLMPAPKSSPHLVLDYVFRT